MFFEVKVLFSDWIAGSCLVKLLKTGQDCSEAGLRIKSFSTMQMFFAALFRNDY